MKQPRLFRRFFRPYVHAILITFLATVLSPRLAHANGEAVCVTADGANLRSGPSTEFDISWRVNKYMPFIRLEEKDGWYKVEDFEKKTHWISKKVVSEKIECLVVKSATAFLRTGPGKEFIKNDDLKVDKYTPFKKLKQERGWSQVEGNLKSPLWIYQANIWNPRDSK